ncbi:E3 ubiquitin-protein ligase TRIP12 [Trichoplax sp. H2]|nr:E3 ubiquitin-protein ligase TRIP12 [Trichoplax sp. H2]|eukprot:RDD46629.1 E3 ubiquitin-protein ligase TRIP12 [Trichoplax sp. H2]
MDHSNEVLDSVKLPVNRSTHKRSPSPVDINQQGCSSYKKQRLSNKDSYSSSSKSVRRSKRHSTPPVRFGYSKYEQRVPKSSSEIDPVSDYHILGDKVKSTNLVDTSVNYHLDNKSNSHTEATGSCSSTSCRGRSPRKPDCDVEGSRAMSSDDQNSSSNSASLSGRDGGQSANANVGASGGIPSLIAHSSPRSIDDLSAPDEGELGRLQALLASRGLPSHLLGALRPHVQQLIQKTVGSASKYQPVLDELQSDSEPRQTEAVMNLSQEILMGNEDTLAGFPVRQIVPALVKLLEKEHNFEIMNHAGRCLTNLLVVLPRTSPVIASAIPQLLNKLKAIEFMDVAEQSLMTLKELSKRHAKAILDHDGINICLTYIDFFPINTQRYALTIAANCCHHVTSKEFYHVKEVLPTILEKLLCQDKICVENSCTCFSRLVGNLHAEEELLLKIVDFNLLKSIQQLLTLSPPLISTDSFIDCVKMLTILCYTVPEAALKLIRQNIANSIRFWLIGSADVDITAGNLKLLPKSIQELHAISSFVCKLLPELPESGIFEIRKHLESNSNISNPIQWQWQDDNGLWRPYLNHHGMLLEHAYRQGEGEVSIEIDGGPYNIDLNSMQQTNELSRMSRPIRRLSRKRSADKKVINQNQEILKAFFEQNSQLSVDFIKSLFAVFYEVYISTPALDVRLRCLDAILKMIYFSSSEVLRDILRDHAISCYLTLMISSKEIRTIASSLLMAQVLMHKLEDVFRNYFIKEGVFHAVANLAKSIDNITSYDDIREPVTSSFAEHAPIKPNPMERRKSNKREKHKSTIESASDRKKSNLNVSNERTSKLRQWIKDQAQRFCDNYYENEASNSNVRHSSNILSKLSDIARSLQGNSPRNIKNLKELKSVTIGGDENITTFEMIHSGVITSLLKFLSGTNLNSELKMKHHIQFLNVFLNFPLSMDKELLSNEQVQAIQSSSPLILLIKKLINCVTQQEEFSVPTNHSISGDGSYSVGYLLSHQLKCQLKRHPSCNNLDQWRGGILKIDPLAQIEALERYLLMRGYGTQSKGADHLDSDEDSDDGSSVKATGQFFGFNNARHQLELLIGDTVLTYNVTFYEAVCRHYESKYGFYNSGRENCSSALWSHVHTVWYRPITDAAAHSEESTESIRKHRKNSSGKSSKSSWKVSDYISKAEILARIDLAVKKKISLGDPSAEIIGLLREIYFMTDNLRIYQIPESLIETVQRENFSSDKLSTKAARLLQDPITVMASTFPTWLTAICHECPFLISFEHRQLLFYYTAFDRERAMIKLQEKTTSSRTDASNSSNSNHRLDKKKKVISRNDILKEAEAIFQDRSCSKSILEIQYDGEVGFGSGPTMEFFTQVSQEFQRCNLNMWRNDVSKSTSDIDGKSYVGTCYGLYPNPIGKKTKSTTVKQICNRFNLLGRFIAKALMDFRLVDLPLSQPFCKWILNLESTLNIKDIQIIDPVFAKSLNDLHSILIEKTRIENDSSNSKENVANLRKLEETVDDLCLDFTLPGQPNFELKKNSKNMSVSLENLEDYLQLVIHWTLIEGVSKQMTAFKEGFESIFPLSKLQIFYPYEINLLFSGKELEKFNMKDLIDCCRTDHGYNHDSRAVKFLFEILSSYETDEQRQFLQFVTGSPRLPIGGLKSLNPPLTIVRKAFDIQRETDDLLPSVMSCVNYLKLPDYSTIEVMSVKLRTAINEGQLSFHLS